MYLFRFSCYFIFQKLHSILTVQFFFKPVTVYFDADFNRFAVMRSGKKDSKRTFPFSGSFIQIKINRRKMPRMESRPVSAACPTVQRPRQHIRPMFFRSRISNIKRFLSPEVRQKAFVIIRIEGKLRCGIILLSYFKEYFISSVYTGRR